MNRLFLVLILCALAPLTSNAVVKRNTFEVQARLNNTSGKIIETQYAFSGLFHTCASALAFFEMGSAVAAFGAHVVSYLKVRSFVPDTRSRFTRPEIGDLWEIMSDFRKMAAEAQRSVAERKDVPVSDVKLIGGFIEATTEVVTAVRQRHLKDHARGRVGFGYASDDYRYGPNAYNVVHEVMIQAATATFAIPGPFGSEHEQIDVVLKSADP